MEGRDPLSPDEYLLRRITAHQYDAKATYPIPFEKFNPRPKLDDDGISFFQESTTTPEKMAPATTGTRVLSVPKTKDLTDATALLN